MNKRQKFTGLNLGLQKNWLGSKRGRKSVAFTIDKRQKFVIGVLILSLALFLTELKVTQLGIFIAILFSAFTDLFLFWAIYPDLRQNKNYQVFILPFFYS